MTETSASSVSDGEPEPVSPPDRPAEEELAGPLPEAVRARVVSLAAEAIGKVAADHLPSSLKRVAAFAPVRRAKLAGNQIASVLETDEEFRGHVATQVRAVLGELGQAVDAGSVPSAADPVELAAAAYLLRPPGWAGLVAQAGGAVHAERAVAATKQASEQVERLRRQLAEAQAESQVLRARHREQVEELKRDNTDLRRKLGEARGRTAAAEAAAEGARASSAEVAAAATTAAAAVDAEVRRLRARVAALESELSGVRRSERSDRDAETLRARLLLDTLLDATQGLRRELALPAVEGLPADSVAAHLAQPGERAPSGHGSMASDDPALLDALVALPRAHLVVDGYNVTKTAWPELSLAQQRDRLLAGVGPLVARSGAEVTVVFDAAETKDRPLVNPPRGVRVLYSQYGVIADDVIRELVAAEPAGRPVAVVTNDQAVARDVLAAGFRVVGSLALARLVGRSGR